MTERGWRDIKREGIALTIFILILIFINSLIVDTVYTTAFKFFDWVTPVQGFWKITINIVSIIFASLIVFTSIVIILERRDPAKTLAWLLILIFLPIIGFVLYLILGRQFRKRRMTARKKFLNNYIYPLDDTFAQNRDALSGITLIKERLIQLILNSANFPLTLHNDVKVLTDGKEIFPAFLQAMEAAKEHIHLETYILRDDKIGQKIGSILCNKAQAGVKVRIIYDGLGSRQLSRKYLEELKRAGVEVKAFFPVRLPFLHNKINYRNHRKILVIDGKTGFLGGINIGDEYVDKDPNLGYWRDTHLQLQGNSVYFLQRIFLQDWYFLTGQSLEKSYEDLFPLKNSPGEKVVQIAASGPDTHWEPIMQIYYYTIATAQKSIYLTSPYFVPNESILTALTAASLSGVNVKILLPSKTDHKITFWAAMSYLEELMEAGVEIYLYQKGFIHAKSLAIDGILSSIGSANMDQRSFNLNFEVNALIYDEETTRRLEQDFWEDLKHSVRVDPEEFKQRSLPRRVFESGCRLFSPLL